VVMEVVMLGSWAWGFLPAGGWKCSEAQNQIGLRQKELQEHIHLDSLSPLISLALLEI
jgi:hypothetical protein